MMALDALDLCRMVDSERLADGFDGDEEVVRFVGYGNDFDAVDGGDELSVHML